MRCPGFLVLLLLSLTAQGQSALNGKVYDAETGQPVIGAHVIGVGVQRVGTSTNGEGAFVLHARQAPDSLRISCIGYRTTVVPLAATTTSLNIRLRPHIVSLQAVTIKPPSPQQLIRDAVQTLGKTHMLPPLQLRGFYREVIRRDTTYYSVAEAVFESQLPRRGDDEALLRLVQGRRSESVSSTRIFEDYHPGGGPNYLLNHLLEAQVPEFLMDEAFDDYVYTIDSIAAYDDKEVYIIHFDQREGLKKNLWKGRIAIEAETHALIDVTYALSDKGAEYRKHLSGTDQIMANLLGIDYTVLDRHTRYSYRMTDGQWKLHQASLTMDIHFRQPRKDIDETFRLEANLLSLGQQPGPLVPFEKNEVWRKNQLVKNLPGEFDEAFWGTDNILRPEASLTAAVASMDILRASALSKSIPEGWNLFHASEANIYQQKNALLIKPYVVSRWKDQEQGPFLWKSAMGDFELTAKVRVTKTQDTLSAPDVGFQLGGLMLRAGQGDSENHVLFGIGCMGNPQIKLVSQHTIRNNSAVYVSKTDTHEMLLRIRRQGATVELLRESEGNNWTLVRKFTVDQWPAEIQYGIAGFAYVTGSGPKRRPDLLIQVEQLTFTRLVP